jgi:tetratricopeptide (TPR) repeat protein
VPITSTRSEVAGDIVHAMQVQLTPKEQARLARSQRTNSEAYDLYLRALALNPSLAEARHQLASVYNHIGLLDKASGEAQKAVALDPRNTGARFRVGLIFSTKANTKSRSRHFEIHSGFFRHSLRFNPPSLSINWEGRMRLQSG